ncbi:MAG TPA: hypothetical protein VKU83_10930 [Puia sp.]|nr:hypothetical protein [Puia sp.]
MRRLWLFYLIIFGPVAIWSIFIFHPALRSGISDTGFIIGLAFFLFVYRPAICGLRLVATGKIKRSQFILNFIPFWSDKYWSFLFFNLN